MSLTRKFWLFIHNFKLHKIQDNQETTPRQKSISKIYDRYNDDIVESEEPERED